MRARRTRGPAEGRWGLVALAALILAALSVAWAVVVRPQPAQAQTGSTLVSNTGQTDGFLLGFESDFALPFTTGTHSGGYRVTSVEIEGGFTGSGSTAPTFTVSIHTGSGTSVGDSVGSLTNSGFVTGTNSFTSSSGIDLDANTSYFVVLDISDEGDRNPWLRSTASNGEDSGGSAGWSIGDRITVRHGVLHGSWALAVTTNVVEMSIKGLPRLSLAASPSSVLESADSTEVTVTATVDTAPTSDLTVALSVDSTSTANSGTDYAALGTLDSITIAGGETSGTATVEIDPTEDTIDEPDETIVIAGSASGFADGNTTVTIADNDDTPTVINLSTTPSSVDEDDPDTAITVTATLSGNTRSVATEVTLNSTLGGSATGGGIDYTATGLPAKVTIPAEASSGSATGLMIDPAEDAIDEGANETIVVNGSVAGFTVNGATIDLDDNDDPEITLRSERVGTGDDNSVDEGDSATFRITATRNTADRSTRVNVPLAVVTTGADASTATSGTDFTALSSTTIAIAPGAASGARDVTISTTEDRLDEDSGETIVLGATVSGFTVNPVTITIADDDEPSTAITLRVSDNSIGEGETTTTSVTVTAEVDDAAPTSNVTVALSLSGSAVAGTDYADPGAIMSITIAPGQVSGTSSFAVAPTDDSIDEDDETITVNGSATGAFTATAEVDITLTDNDTAALTLDTGTTTSILESAPATSVTVNATLDIERTKSTTVALSLSGSAIKGTDYTAPATLPSITIAAGSQTGSASFDITPTEDRLNEGTGETITISGSATDVTGGSVNVTLTDNDSPSTTITVTAKAAGDVTIIGESDSPASFTVIATLDDAAFSTETEMELTLAGTAMAGTDYTFTPDAPKVTFDVGKPSATTTVSIHPTHDKIDEGASETIVVGVESGLTVNTATITLTDDDTASSVTLRLDELTLREADGDRLTTNPVEGESTPVTVTATIDDGITRVVDTVVTLSLSGTATNHANDLVNPDYRTSPSPPGSITIDAGDSVAEAEITFTPLQDAITENDETIRVDGTATGLTVSSAQLTLYDDDSPSTSLALSMTSRRALLETSDATAVHITAVLDGGTLTSDVVVGLTLGGPAQGDGVDYTMTESSLPDITILAGSTQADATTIHIDPVDDSVQEAPFRTSFRGGVRHILYGSEDITLSGTATVSGSTDTLDVSDASLPIRDNDIASTRIGLSVDDSSIDEDATGASYVTVTATLDGDVTRSEPTEVALTFGGSATLDTDYTAAPEDPTVTIAAEASTGTATLTITPVNDEDDEGLETIIVRGSADGFSVRETTVNLVDDDLVVIGAVADLAASLQGRNAASLSWTPPVPGPVTGYRLQRRTADGDWADVATPEVEAVAHTDRGLGYSTDYVWRLYASNEHGEGPASNEATVTTGSRPPTGGGPVGGGPVGGGDGGGGDSPGEPPAGLSVPEPLSRPPRFTDVDPRSALAPGIERAATLGIMPGTSGDRFEPERLVSRLDTAAPMVRLWQALGGTCPRVTRSPFRDLPARGSARVDIACLHALGITNGTGTSTYSPERILNRAQMMTLMARIWRLRGHDCPDDPPDPFADVADGHFHRDDILCMYAIGVTNGTSATTFSPDWQLTRAEVAVFAARFYDAARAA